MRIMVIAFGDLSRQEIEIRQKHLRTLCSRGTEVEVAPIREGPDVTDATTLSLAVPGILKRVNQAARESYDAIMINCFADPGLEAAKTLVNIPVVGGGEPNYHVASLLADRFGLVTLTKEFIPIMARQTKVYGVADRIVSIRSFDIPVAEFQQRKEEVEARFIEQAKEQVDSGAQLIIPACLATLPALGAGSADRLSQKLGVMVLDSNATALKMAEMLANLGVSQSKLAFPRAG